MVMAGRGRGHLTLSVEIVGIPKGENLPPSSIQPNPLYPPLEQKPVPLQAGDEAEYMLALKQEFRGAMKNLPFYIRPAAPKRDVERYSDKYQRKETFDNSWEWKPDWRRFPKELRVKEKRPQRDKTPTLPKLPKQPRVDKKDIIRKLETLEQKEGEGSSDEEEGEKKKKPEEEEAEGEEDFDEDEFEDETDYIMSYFDNGEEFGGDSDENLDEAIY